MNTFYTVLFNIGYTISLLLDLLIFDKLNIELKHSYSRHKYLPCDEFWIAQEQAHPNSVSKTIKDGTFMYVLFDKDKVVMQNVFYGMGGKKTIDDVTTKWFSKVEGYVEKHLTFSLSQQWIDFFSKKLCPIKDKPLHILALDGKWYSCNETDGL